MNMRVAGKPHYYANARGWWLYCQCYFKWLTEVWCPHCGEVLPWGSWLYNTSDGTFRLLTLVYLCFIFFKDWNTFLLRFNDLDLCVSENETLKHLTNDTTTPESTMTSGQTRVSTQSPQGLEDSGPINISVAITLTLDPLKPFGGYSRNVTHLYLTILGHQIGLSGMWVLAIFLSDLLRQQLLQDRLLASYGFIHQTIFIFFMFPPFCWLWIKWNQEGTIYYIFI